MAFEREFGIVGLGKIGTNLALQALEANFRVVGHDIRGVPEAIRKAGAIDIDSPEAFLGELRAPRKVFVYVPAGGIVDQVLDQLADVLEQGDVLVDGGNSYWGDSLRRHDRYAQRGLHFVDLGTSGGIEGAAKGACFMAGGQAEAVELVEPILQALAVDGGYVHAGPPGAGHFVKLVHNGIEFGMLQAIGEGMALLEKYKRDREQIDVAEVLRCWSHGSVIRSWLIELMERSYRQEGGLKPVPPYIEDTGEVNWLVSDAMHLEVAVPVMTQSVMHLFASRDDDQHWARAIAMMRHEFGGHPFGTDPGIAKERREGRVGPFPSAKGKS